MPLIHDPAKNIGDIFNDISEVLYDTKLTWFSSSDILASLQDQYNKLVALLCPIEHSTLIPKISDLYYPLRDWIPDFLYVSAIFNPTTNLWLEGRSYKTMKSDYQTYFMVGEPKFFSVTDFRRTLIWPYPPASSGVIYVIYKAKAPKISMDHIPVLPHSCGSQLLQFTTIYDLLEQAREFKKAQIWLDKVYKPLPGNTKSLYDQALEEIKNLNRMDRETTLEPYRWIFHGGNFKETMWINNETPTGTIDGSNAVFTLAKVPNPSSSLLLTKNGQILYESSGFTLSGQTITFQTGFIPQNSGELQDEIRVWYQVA